MINWLTVDDIKKDVKNIDTQTLSLKELQEKIREIYKKISDESLTIEASQDYERYKYICYTGEKCKSSPLLIVNIHVEEDQYCPREYECRSNDEYILPDGDTIACISCKWCEITNEIVIDSVDTFYANTEKMSAYYKYKLQNDLCSSSIVQNFSDGEYRKKIENYILAMTTIANREFKYINNRIDFGQCVQITDDKIIIGWGDFSKRTNEEYRAEYTFAKDTLYMYYDGFWNRGKKEKVSITNPFHMWKL